MTKQIRQRRRVNVTTDQQRAKDARAQGVNLSKAAEDSVRKVLAEKWLKDSAGAIRQKNEWAEKNGLPLENTAWSDGSIRRICSA